MKQTYNKYLVDHFISGWYDVICSTHNQYVQNIETRGSHFSFGGAMVILIAMQNFNRALKIATKLSDETTLQKLHGALEEIFSSTLRHMVEHWDDYAIGDGRCPVDPNDRNAFVNISYTAEGLFIIVGNSGEERVNTSEFIKTAYQAILEWRSVCSSL